MKLTATEKALVRAVQAYRSVGSPGTGGRAEEPGAAGIRDRLVQVVGSYPEEAVRKVEAWLNRRAESTVRLSQMLAEMRQAPRNEASVVPSEVQAQPMVSDDLLLRQLIEKYRIKADYDKATGAWASYKPPKDTSPMQFGRDLNKVAQLVRGKNAIWKNFLEEQMSDKSMNVREYKATLREESNYKNRHDQQIWLASDGRKNVFTTRDEAALAAGAYFVVTGDDFFLGNWGRVAGSGVALVFGPGGVHDGFSGRGDLAYHDVRAVGSSES